MLNWWERNKANPKPLACIDEIENPHGHQTDKARYRKRNHHSARPQPNANYTHSRRLARKHANVHLTVDGMN